jgi:hypothetical protein
MNRHDRANDSKKSIESISIEFDVYGPGICDVLASRRLTVYNLQIHGRLGHGLRRCRLFHRMCINDFASLLMRFEFREQAINNPYYLIA